MNKRNNERDRRARVAQMREEHRRAERRRSLLIIGPAIVVALVLIGTAGFVVVGRQRQQAQTVAAAQRAIAGVKSYPKLPRYHVETPVNYPQTPAVGGNHAPVWTNCGSYSKPVDEMQTVHSMEHGAVWLTYQPSLGLAQVSTLTDLAKRNDWVVLSPFDGIGSPVVVTAWGKQLALNSVDDPRLATFLQKYQQGPQTPELGAPCTGGTGGM